jgi:hypothetical protein
MMDYVTLAAKGLLSLIIIALCAYVAAKTGRLHALTAHRGLKSFRDAFIFFAAAFALNILVVAFSGSYAQQPFLVLFNYTVSMGGFLLVYSLVWKELGDDWHYVLHAAAITAALTDLYFMRYAAYITQIAVLSAGVFLAYGSYRKKRQPMRQLLFISITLAALGYAVNLASALLAPSFRLIWVPAYLITLGTFALISFAVARSLGGSHG